MNKEQENEFSSILDGIRSAIKSENRLARYEAIVDLQEFFKKMPDPDPKSSPELVPLFLTPFEFEKFNDFFGSNPRWITMFDNVIKRSQKISEQIK